MSPQQQPKTKAEKIIENINNMLLSGESSDFLIKKYKLEANKLRSTNQADAFTILGMIACIEKNVEEMHASHINAIAYSDDFTHLLNYSVSLYNLGLFEESYKYAIKAHRQTPGDQRAIDELVKITGMLEMNDEFEKYSKKWAKLTGEEHMLTKFPEDDDRTLSQMIQITDVSIDYNPGLIVKPDPELIKLADELIDEAEADS